MLQLNILQLYIYNLIFSMQGPSKGLVKNQTLISNYLKLEYYKRLVSGD